jgi:hypothetical protein
MLSVTSQFVLDDEVSIPASLPGPAWYSHEDSRTESAATVPAAVPLSPGVHVVRCSSTLSLVKDGRTFWSATHDVLCDFEVVAGGDPDPVRLIMPAVDEDKFGVGSLTFETGTQQVQREVILRSELPCAVAGTVEVRDASGTLVNTRDVCLWAGNPQERIPVPPGGFSVTLTPNPKVAQAKTATVREIYGKPLTRKVTVE